MVERGELGGTCLNAGCIPTKSLLKTAKVFQMVRDAAAFGVEVNAEPIVNWARAVERKNATVTQLREGVRAMMARAQVVVVEGEARMAAPDTVEINDAAYYAPRVIVATGASPMLPDVDGNYLAHVYSTTAMLDLNTLPERLVILGGHPISLGFTSILAMVGVQVTVIDPNPEIMTGFIDAELAAGLRAALPDVDFLLNRVATAITTEAVTLADDTVIPADAVLANVGRAPNLKAVRDMSLDIRDGGIAVDGFMRTNLPNVYAIGDVTGQHQWAHVAIREAETAVSHMLDEAVPMDYERVPVPVYTVPEVAGVGLTEDAARGRGYNIRVARMPLSANGRYITDRAVEGIKGLCKIVVDADTNILLGVHLLGGQAAETAFGAAAMLADEFRVQDVRDLTFAHPTVSEVLKDTLLMS